MSVWADAVFAHMPSPFYVEVCFWGGGARLAGGGVRHQKGTNLQAVVDLLCNSNTYTDQSEYANQANVCHKVGVD